MRTAIYLVLVLLVVINGLGLWDIARERRRKNEGTFPKSHK